jgi:WhiB family redox-sensing transcriptional regulator
MPNFSPVVKSICRECGVRDACLEFAITTGEKFGIWGGMSERERRRVRRERQVAAVRKVG